MGLESSFKINIKKKNYQTLVQNKKKNPENKKLFLCQQLTSKIKIDFLFKHFCEFSLTSKVLSF